MTDWRAHAENDDWMRIDLDQLTADELVELQEIVLARVPKRTRGDGLEIFEDFIGPNQTHDRIALRAAIFRGHLLRNPILNRLRILKLFSLAVELAKSTLQGKLGITYETLLDTYLEELPDGTLIPVCRADGEARLKQFASKFDLSLDAEKEPIRSRTYVEDLRHWVLRHPARRTMSLPEHWYWEKFEANSDIDHAISILDAEFRFSFLFHHDWGVATEANSNVGMIDPWIVAELGFKIGRHYDALQKKPVEQDAIKKRKEVKRNSHESGPRGGQVQAWKANERKAVLNRRAKEDGGFLHISAKDKVLTSQHWMDGRGNVFFVPDKDAIARAMRLAQAYNIENDPRDKLFWHRGKFLSKEWFEKWWAEFKIGQK